MTTTSTSEQMTEIDFEGDGPAPTPIVPVPAPNLTHESILAMSPSEVDALLRAFIRTAADSRTLRLRLIELEDRYADARDSQVWSERSLEEMALELDRARADREVAALNAQGLMLELSMVRMATEDRGNALSLLGLAVGLLLEDGVERDDPRVLELAGKARRLGVGRSTPIRTGPLGPSLSPSPSPASVRVGQQRHDPALFPSARCTAGGRPVAPGPRQTIPRDGGPMSGSKRWSEMPRSSDLAALVKCEVEYVFERGAELCVVSQNPYFPAWCCAEGDLEICGKVVMRTGLRQM